MGWWSRKTAGNDMQVVAVPVAGRSAKENQDRKDQVRKRDKARSSKISVEVAKIGNNTDELDDAC